MIGGALGSSYGYYGDPYGYYDDGYYDEPVSRWLPVAMTSSTAGSRYRSYDVANGHLSRQ